MTEGERRSPLAGAASPDVYVCDATNWFWVIARTERNEESVSSIIAKFAREQGRTVFFDGSLTLDAALQRLSLQASGQVWLLQVLIFAASLLSACGIYGSVHYLVVTQRMALGIQLVLGSTPWRITGAILKDLSSTFVAGSVCGVVLFYACHRLLAAILEVRSDTAIGVWIVWTVALWTIGLAAGLAASIDIWRIDPVTLLRSVRQGEHR